MARELEHYWFAGTESGCGTGRAISWQGWLLSAVYGLVLAAAALLIERTALGFVAIVLVATAVLLVVCNAKTRGGLRFGWGCARKAGRSARK